ncbi:MerR family transcriptional regulator [Nocardia sp. NPDC127579]|uniref:MerR family transcriptional regulator n=1 Tax=Nocardia sp. NPDC127579 TaxID=3345402 RepID=UPI003642B595
MVMAERQRGELIGIGELASRAGLSVRTIRFYCDEGLLEARRSAGGHRMFEADGAVERLLLVRQLRALGLGLSSIAEVLLGERSIGEVIAAESALVEDEFRELAWRRASLRAVADAPHAERARRLALLAAAQDGHTAHDRVVRFWRRFFPTCTRADFDSFVCANIPRPSVDPSVEEVVAFAELADLVDDPDLLGVMGQQMWRWRPETIRDRRALFTSVGEVLIEVMPLVSARERPRAGTELDRFVDVHAGARGEQDCATFRRLLLADATDEDPRIHRYWTLTGVVSRTPVTVGRAHDWLYRSLRLSPAPN